MKYLPVISMLEEDGDLGGFLVNDLLDIESTGSNAEANLVGNAFANVVVIIAFVKILLVICSESSFGVGVKGFKPDGEVEPFWGGWDLDCRYGGRKNDVIRQILVS